MGGTTGKGTAADSESKVTRDSFKFIDALATGDYFKMWKVKMKKSNKNYLMKQIVKAKLSSNALISLVLNERRFLAKMLHPFIVNIHYAFQDDECLYLVYDCLSGEDLASCMEKQKTFNENQTKFFVSCALLALEYCMSNKVVHFNATPESFLFTSYGYIKLHDFSLARVHHNHCEDSKESLTVFDLRYAPPEVICGLSPLMTNDLFSVGVISYEMMNGSKPFEGSSLVEVRNSMMIKEASMKAHCLWSQECIDFISRLLRRKPHSRLGFACFNEVKSHPWLSDVEWEKLYNQEVLSPFISQRNYSPVGAIPQKRDKKLFTISKQARVKAPAGKSPFVDFFYFNRSVMDKEDKLLGHSQSYLNPHKKLYEKPPKQNGGEEKSDINSLSIEGQLSRNGLQPHLNINVS